MVAKEIAVGRMSVRRTENGFSEELSAGVMACAELNISLCLRGSVLSENGSTKKCQVLESISIVCLLFATDQITVLGSLR